MKKRESLTFIKVGKKFVFRHFKTCHSDFFSVSITVVASYFVPTIVAQLVPIWYTYYQILILYFIVFHPLVAQFSFNVGVSP